MLLYGQDPHVMQDPLHRHPGLVAALDEESADYTLDTALEDALLRRHLDLRKLARAA